jgi:Flp pilus assembly protein TadG
VEAAITLPIVLLLGLGVTDIGRAFYYREAVTNATRQALRLAVSPTQQATANTVCASAGAGPVASTVTTTLPPGATSITSIANLASLESSSNGEGRAGHVEDAAPDGRVHLPHVMDRPARAGHPDPDEIALAFYR